MLPNHAAFGEIHLFNLLCHMNQIAFRVGCKSSLPNPSVTCGDSSPFRGALR